MTISSADVRRKTNKKFSGDGLLIVFIILGQFSAADLSISSLHKLHKHT